MKKDYLIVDIETTGLDPMVNEITCIGFLDRNNRIYHYINDKSEEDMLNSFWGFLDKIRPDFLVGWNIDNFDWKFLKIRSLINGVKISKYYKKKERLDLMVLLKTPKWQGLNSYTKILFNEQKMQINPIDLFREKKFEKLVEYNSKDLDLTRKVFERCVECGVIVEEERIPLDINKKCID